MGGWGGGGQGVGVKEEKGRCVQSGSELCGMAKQCKGVCV